MEKDVEIQYKDIIVFFLQLTVGPQERSNSMQATESISPSNINKNLSGSDGLVNHKHSKRVLNEGSAQNKKFIYTIRQVEM